GLYFLCVGVSFVLSPHGLKHEFVDHLFHMCVRVLVADEIVFLVNRWVPHVCAIFANGELTGTVHIKVILRVAHSDQDSGMIPGIPVALPVLGIRLQIVCVPPAYRIISLKLCDLTTRHDFSPDFKATEYDGTWPFSNGVNRGLRVLYDVKFSSFRKYSRHGYKLFHLGPYKVDPIELGIFIRLRIQEGTNIG